VIILTVGRDWLQTERRRQEVDRQRNRASYGCGCLTTLVTTLIGGGAGYGLSIIANNPDDIYTIGSVLFFGVAGAAAGVMARDVQRGS
jgi:hypothetical protein